MITHVAEASENKGRVIVVDTQGRPAAGALDAAVLIARAFGAAIEALIVDRRDVHDLALYPFARAVSLATGRATMLAPVAVAEDRALLAAAAHRALGRHAARAGIGFASRTWRSDTLAAIAETCRRLGPWNVLVIADPAPRVEHRVVEAALAGELQATGLVLAGPLAMDARGAIVAVIEDAGRAPHLLRTALRLAAVEARAVELLLLASDPGRRDVLEGQLRLMLDDGDAPTIHLAEPTRGVARAAIRSLHQRTPGLAIVAGGGALAESAGDAATLPAQLACPVLITR